MSTDRELQGGNTLGEHKGGKRRVKAPKSRRRYSIVDREGSRRTVDLVEKTKVPEAGAEPSI
jgi:hypothetical protein